MSSSAIAQSAFNFDAVAAAQARDRGRERAERKANADWFSQMVEVGKQVARSKPMLTTDDIVREYAKDPSRPTTHSMRAMSGVMRRLQDDRVIEITGEFVNSERVKQHRCPIRRYRSMIFKG